MLKSWICGGKWIGLWFSICRSFVSLLFLFLRHLQLTVRRVGFFFFSVSHSEVHVGYSRLVVFFSPEVFIIFKWFSTNSRVSLACVVTTCVRLTFSLRISRGFKSSWVRGVFAAFERIISWNEFSVNSVWIQLTSELVHLSLLCPWLLHFALVATVLQHLFTLYPYLRHFSKLNDLS